ncbi:MAG: T9SS type A sorting domain-containing protein [Saprospiraceae bacterium]|nr:T9SS type A sorting domain-containing protein [Saprospiraceae bacterium]
MRNIILSLVALLVILIKSINAQDVKIVDIQLNDLVYIPYEDRIYGTLSGQYPNGNSLVVINPYIGKIEKYYQIGSQPNAMTVSKDGKSIYIGLDAQKKIIKYDIKEKEIVYSFFIGKDEFGNPLTLEDVHEFPLDSSVLVGLLYNNFGVKEIAAFKNGIKLSKTLNAYGYLSITVTEDGRVFTYDNQNYQDGLMELEIEQDGIYIKRRHADIIQRSDSRLKSKGEFLYTNFGKFINISDTIAYVDGICNFETYYRAEGVSAPDTNLIYFIYRDVNSKQYLATYNHDNYSFSEKIELPHNNDAPIVMITWGDNKKLAAIYGNKLLITRQCTSLLIPPYDIPVSNYGGCYYDQIQLSAPEGSPYYLWSTGETTRSITVNYTGNYYFRMADTLGCIADTSFLVKVTLDSKPSPPYFEGNGFYTLCHGQSLTLTPNNYYSEYRILWSTGETTPSIKVSQPGKYYLSYVTKNDCKSDISNILTVTQINDTVPPKPKIKDIEFNTICYGTTLLLEAPVGYNYYIWNTGANTQMISTTYSGSFAVKVANNQQCFSEYSEPIILTYSSNPSKPYILANDNLLASSAPIGNQWYFNGQVMVGDTSRFLNATKNGFYSVQVTINGCKSLMSDLFNFKLVSATDDKLENKIFLYPNPATDFLNVILPYDFKSTRLEIFNSNGIKIKQCSNVNNIDLRDILSGIYIIRIFEESTNKVFSKRFIKID